MKKYLAIAVAGALISGAAFATVSGHYYNFPLHDGNTKVYVVEKVDARTNEVIETKYFPVDPACITVADDVDTASSEVEEESSVDHNGIDSNDGSVGSVDADPTDHRAAALTAALATTGLVLSVEDKGEVGFWEKAANFLTASKDKLQSMADTATAKYEQLVGSEKTYATESEALSDAPDVGEAASDAAIEAPKPESPVAAVSPAEDLVK